MTHDKRELYGNIWSFTSRSLWDVKPSLCFVSNFTATPCQIFLSYFYISENMYNVYFKVTLARSTLASEERAI